MPKDSAQRAVSAFLEPFRNALSVLDASGQIVIPRQGSWITRKTYSWVLNPQTGMKLGSAGTFYASMQFQLIDRGHNKLAVQTIGYNYRLEQPGGSDRWRMHWHPVGVSNVREFHLHIPPDLKVHRPCDQMSFQNALRWCINDGAPLSFTVQEVEDELLRLEKPVRSRRPSSFQVPEPRGRNR